MLTNSTSAFQSDRDIHSRQSIFQLMVCNTVDCVSQLSKNPSLDVSQINQIELLLDISEATLVLMVCLTSRAARLVNFEQNKRKFFVNTL